MTSKQKARAARWWAGFSVTLALWGAGACGTDPKHGTQCTSDCDGGDDSGPIGSNTQMLIKGRVFDADTGKAVSDANIKSEGGDKQSDADGYFELPAPKDGTELQVSKDSYAAKTQSAPRAGYVEVFIKSDDRTLEFDAEKGTKVKLDSGASIEFPPGVIVDKDGTQIKGTVKLKVADIDGSDAKQAMALPSQNEGKSADGELGKVSVERALSITVLDKDGNELTVDPAGKTIAELPVQAADAEAEGRGFSYDESEKQWVEEEPVVRTLNDDGQVVYQKSIRHLSWHGYGKHFAKLTCARLCVQDAQRAPIVGAQVWALGVSFPGVLTFVTDEDGCSTEDLPASQDLQLVARDDKAVSSTLLLTTSDDELHAADGADECAAVPALTLIKAQPSPCPLGYEECGSVCIDTRISPKHCGSCDQACGGTAGRAQACIAGVCACPGRTTACGDGAELACANLASDPAHCGDCDTACAQNERCVAGGCVATSCPQGLMLCGRECVDLTSNQSNCGECGNACGADEVCLGECVSTSSPTLCSVNTSIVCDDGAYCNGVEVCDPTSSLAAANGCVNAQPPCAAVLCDEELDSCSDAVECVPSTYVTLPGHCTSSVGTCLANVGSGDFAFSNAILCGAADETPASGTDELGSGYDCESCIRNDLMVCAAYYGCGDQASALDCCVQTTSCTDQGCIAELCGAEVTALSSCLSDQGQNSRCLSFITSSVCMTSSSVPTINSFTGPTEACEGSLINLSYDFSGGSGLLLPTESFLAPGAGQRQVTLERTTNYSLTVSNQQHEASAQVTVNAISGPEISLSGPTTAARGQPSLRITAPDVSAVSYAWSIESGYATLVAGQGTSQAEIDIGTLGSSITVQLVATSAYTGCSTTVEHVIHMPCSEPLPISYDRSAEPAALHFTPVNMDTRPPAFAANGVVWAPYLTRKISSSNLDANFGRVVAGEYDAPAGSPVTFNSSSDVVYYVKVATDDVGNAVFVWTQNSDGQLEVMLQAFRASTGWLPAHTVGPLQTNTQDAPASVVMHPTNGTALIAWMGPPYPSSIPYLRSYSLTDDSLGEPTALEAENAATRAAQFSGMSLATDANLNGFVTWFEDDGDYVSLLAVHLTAGEPDTDVETGPIVDVLANSESSSDQISYNSTVWQTAAYEVKTVTGSPDGHFAVLWPNHTYDEQTQTITGTLSVRRFFNGEWGPRETAASRTGAFSNVDFAIDNQGDMILAARSHANGDDTFASGVHGQAWSILRVLSGGDLSTLPYVTLDPTSGQGVVTYRDYARPSPYPLVAARYNPATQQLAPSFVVSDPLEGVTDSGRPFLSPDGTLRVVFAQSESPTPETTLPAHLYLTTCQ